MPWGPKLVPLWGHMFYIGLFKKKHEKIFVSETTRPRALMFGIKHHLANLCQVCSNYIPGANMARPGSRGVLQSPISGKHEKLFLSDTIRLRALIFDLFIT